MKIIIADDHPIVLAGVRDVIADEAGLDIIGQALSPSTLVEMMRALTPDLVICDYNMPGNGPLGDGIKLISYLRRHFPSCKVLVLTMISTPSMVEAMYRAGANGVVRKSGDLLELRVALSALRSRRVYRPRQSPEEQLQALKKTDTAALSPRELEVMRLFINGKSVSDIARQLNRSSKTVSTQKINAMRKLGTQSDQDLIALCLESDLFR
ncbi:LuxR family transcriptional regulator [Stenotrophomonas humi]|uniref:LuxR family transcriptional regulator n=1 Tax=Stenotrophomonas humi TaxID=405444 RepID=A0A0R0CD00_9GAMM|nr:response regulator transcription factor [Stenotrophomonas humi]KRG64482.1 LuxR family transcriptional regulator [Stenotrophomonas humi]